MGWEYVVVLIVAALVAVALAPKPPTPEPATLEDVDAPVAEEGKAIPVVFGDAWVTGSNVLWYGDLRSTPIIKSSGKK